MLKSPKYISLFVVDTMGRFTQFKFPFSFCLAYLYFRDCKSKFFPTSHATRLWGRHLSGHGFDRKNPTCTFPFPFLLLLCQYLMAETGDTILYS